jgi:hypothetical protein
MHRSGKEYDPRNMAACVVSPSAPDDEWWAEREKSSPHRSYNQNRNLVARVAVGSIAMIPRPDRGVVYCGRVSGPFELVDDPPWRDSYLATRREQGLSEDSPESWHVADVAQCWPVDKFRPVPIPPIPGWIRRSFFGRGTYGVVPTFGEMDPHSIMDRVIDGPDVEVRDWTTDKSEVERRLLTDLVPDTFEHLVVGLLQLEHPSEVWIQVGGSGDGGIDGIGADAQGTVTGLLQCKWQYWNDSVEFGHARWGDAGRRGYLAALMYPEPINKPDGIMVLDRPTIAGLVLKHADQLSQAVSMRVGRPK